MFQIALAPRQDIIQEWMQPTAFVLMVRANHPSCAQLLVAAPTRTRDIPAAEHDDSIFRSKPKEYLRVKCSWDIGTAKQVVLAETPKLSDGRLDRCVNLTSVAQLSAPIEY